MFQPPIGQFAQAIEAAPRQAVASRTVAARVWAAVLTLLRLPGHVVAIRRDMALLGAMDDRALHDIGLCRQDLRDAAALPFAQHPDRLFRDRVAARRRRRANHRVW